MFGYRDSRGAVEVAFTDRHGGVSEGTYSSLNLAIGGGDDPAVVAENLRRVAARFNDGGPLAGMRQVHGGAAAAADPDRVPQCDGLVTVTREVALVVRVADCVPVLLADPEEAVIGAVHAGRKGMVAGIVPATVRLMRSMGAQRLVAWVGPHICGGCYEVPAELRDEVSAEVPEAYSETTWGTPALDIGAGARAQLAAAGAEIVEAARCTREHHDLYSYRRDGAVAGRCAGLIRIVPGIPPDGSPTDPGRTPKP